VPLLRALEKMGMASGVSEGLSEAVALMERVSGENALEKPVRDNFSKSLALGVCGTVPVVYGFGVYRGVVQRFKQQFNENSKVPSKWEVFPELNHNEIVGWEGAGKLAKHFSAVFIRDEAESVEIRNRIETTKALMQSASKGFEVWSRGNSALAKMLSTVCVGDFTSVYLAVLRNVDPTPVSSIAFLKEKMKAVGTREKIIRELKRMVAK
jgi:glucose/mannose-6-phosphate isomerase